MTMDKKPNEITFEWDRRLSVGFEALDQDHKFLVNLGNLLAESTSEYSSPTILKQTLILIDESILGHFLREEKAMAAVNYSDLRRHAALHREFYTKFKALHNAFNDGANTAIDQLNELLTGFISNHIINEDLKYAKVITKVDSRPIQFLIIEAMRTTKY